MKLRVMFKTPHAVADAISDCAADLGQDVRDEARAYLVAVTEKFVRYGEIVAITFDTEDQSATVERVGTR